jgi:soluble epoxide hydrolase / lipid-phosphate phosphatase
MVSLTTHLLAMSSLLAATTACLQTKQLTTRDGTNYVYDYVPAQGNNATVLLIHGYPATRLDWKHQVQDLSAAGYGVIATDCLGYGESDKRLEVEAYNLKRIAGHLTEVLDEEGVETVIGVGHDWGTNVLSRTSVWHPDRFQKLAFLSLGYSAPGIFADIDALNALSFELLGYMQFGYFYFFNSYNAADLAASKVSTPFRLQEIQI